MTDTPQITSPTEPRPVACTPDDSALVRQARAGDAAARALLVSRWATRVLAYCRARIGDDQGAEDAAQEALLRAMQSLDSLEHGSSFGGWLRRIALNLCRDWHRARRTRDRCWSTVTDRSLEEFAIDERGAGTVPCEQREELDRLTEAVSRLPVTEQEVLHLHYFDHLTYDEIARLLGVARSTVNARLSSARALLRKELER